MSARSTAAIEAKRPRVQSARERARKAERALGELSLSVTTFADKKRIDIVQTGMRALDDEQASVKDTVAAAPAGRVLETAQDVPRAPRTISDASDRRDTRREPSSSPVIARAS